MYEFIMLINKQKIFMFTLVLFVYYPQQQIEQIKTKVIQVVAATHIAAWGHLTDEMAQGAQTCGRILLGEYSLTDGFQAILYLLVIC